MQNPIQAKISNAEAFANDLEHKQASEVNGGWSARDVIPNGGASPSRSNLARQLVPRRIEGCHGGHGRLGKPLTCQATPTEG